MNSRVVGIADIYASRGGRVEQHYQVNVYPSSPGWKAVIRRIVARAREDGYTVQLLLPIYYTGVKKARTPQQIAFDKAMTTREPERCALATVPGRVYTKYRPMEQFDLEHELEHTPVKMPLGNTQGIDYPKTYQVDSGSVPGKSYVVKLLSPGFGECECKGFSYRHRCKHVEKAKARDAAGLLN